MCNTVFLTLLWSGWELPCWDASAWICVFTVEFRAVSTPRPGLAKIESSSRLMRVEIDQILFQASTIWLCSCIAPIIRLFSRRMNYFLSNTVYAKWKGKTNIIFANSMSRPYLVKAAPKAKISPSQCRNNFETGHKSYIPIGTFIHYSITT